jgi:hypothetical protein
MSEPVRPNALVVGSRYRVEIEDCCVEGQLVGTYLGSDDDLDEDWQPTTRWDFGTLQYGGKNFYPL